MSNLTLWLAAPRFDEEELNKERATLTCEEKVALARDLYLRTSCIGAGGETKQHACEAHDFGSAGVARIDDELESMPEELKESLLEAQRRCPELVGDAEKLLFLRCEPSHDVSMAAENMCRYWKKRREVFGDDKAFLPLTLEGALQGCEFLSVCPLLPIGFDKADRLILLQDSKGYEPSKHNRNDVIRAMWYFYETYMPLMDDPGKGAVLVFRPSDSSRKEEEKMDRKLYKQIMEIQDIVPLDFKAYHMLNPPWHVRVIVPALRFMMGRERRQRFVVHQGTNKELSESMAKHGIPTHGIPTINGMKNAQRLLGCVDTVKQRKVDRSSAAA